uniref:uncharacterized protein LOC122589238 isoform X2 n=1 Tax=Erigeron canadensis TaxID=72917 RepID=UPI001CB9508E|nr:uncharacterized protein LOC122589238 isoform X2 [Erigeron canadensis]
MNVLNVSLKVILIITVGIQSVYSSEAAVCEYSYNEQNKVYNYNLAAASSNFPHGILSPDGYYKVSSNGTVVWFQLCDAMIFNHDPPRCFDCFGCGESAQCGMGCSALMSNNLFGYPICTTIGLTSTITTDLIDKRNPHTGLLVKMRHDRPELNCSLSVYVICDSKQVQGPTTLETVNLCNYATQLRHPSACAQIVSSSSNGFGWFGTLLIIILCPFGGYLLAGAAYRFFYLGIHGIDIVPNLEFWANLPHRAQSAIMSLVRRFRGHSKDHRSSYSPVAF